MTGTKRRSLGGTRRVGLALAGVLAAGLAVLSGTAFASSSAPSVHMTDMHMSTGRSHVGTTKGWYDGRTVTFYYSKNFSCKAPPASKASSKCEAGTDYTQTPASSFDPLYVIVPLGFTPAKSTLQCPTAGHCIDHPSTIDLSAVLGKGTGNYPLPPHSHIVATANGHQAEWWNVVVVGVTSKASWNKIVAAKSDGELQRLQRNSKSGVTGNITTNLFLYFSVLKR
jgi:ABC-type phosphate transport system substrate-binding protein